MSQSRKKRPLSLRRHVLIIIGVTVMLFSCCPLIFGLMNVAPTIEYAQHTGTNYSLNYIAPILLAVWIFFGGLIMLLVAFYWKQPADESDSEI